jgi:hypothetical protein
MIPIGEFLLLSAARRIAFTVSNPSLERANEPDELAPKLQN